MTLFFFQISLVSLQLFDTLLQKDDEHIVHNLVLRNLEKREYYSPSAKKQKEKLSKKENDVTNTSSDCKLENTQEGLEETKKIEIKNVSESGYQDMEIVDTVKSEPETELVCHLSENVESELKLAADIQNLNVETIVNDAIEKNKELGGEFHT